MKFDRYSQGGRPSGEAPPPAADTDETVMAFIPCPEEVARRAYFAYINEGSPEGRHVQHWLDAEAGMVSDHERTRLHGFHN